MSSKFGQIRPRTTELAALECMKKSHKLIMGKTMSSHFLRYFNWILFIFAGNEDMIRGWMSSKFGQMRPLVSMATDRVTVRKSVSSRFL